jgi:dihydrofolate reductase/thymidylate synthase
MEFNLIVCVDNNFGIAKNGDIPWKIKEDSDYFKDLIKTKVDGKSNVIVSGRKTFEKMGVIKDAHNIVFTSTQINNEGIYIVKSSDEFIDQLKKLEYGRIFICGGVSIYDEFLKFIEKDGSTVNLYLNFINGSFETNTILSQPLINYCKQMLVYQNPQAENFIKQMLESSINLSEYELTKKSSHIKMLVQNLNDQKFYEFLRFNPVKLKKDTYEYLPTLNKDESTYINVMKDLLINGIPTKGRNGVTFSKFGKTLEFNLQEGFPLLTTKKMFFKGVCEELLFFIKGDTNAKHLSDRGVKIWDKNTSREFLDSLGYKDREEGDMGPMYGYQWKHFNAEYNGINENYDGKGFDQLSYVINELKSNPHSRRIIMTTYNPAQASQGVLFPCHGISIQFNTVQLNNTFIVNLSQNQRSADYFLGVPFNIASYALLLEMICHCLNDGANEFTYIPGKIILFLGDYHIYESHRDQCIKQIKRYPFDFPKIKLNSNKRKLEDFEFSDFELINYNSYPAIQADMIA